jgi:hypothetical protein
LELGVLLNGFPFQRAFVHASAAKDALMGKAGFRIHHRQPHAHGALICEVL